MKYVAIALLLFCIQVGIATTNAIIGPDGVIAALQTEAQPQSEWFDDVNQNQLANEDYVQSQVASDTVNFGFGDFIKGLWYFVKAIGLGIIAVPYMLGLFGVKFPFTYFFSLPIYLIYVMGLAQWIANRGLRSMT